MAKKTVSKSKAPEKEKDDMGYYSAVEPEAQDMLRAAIANKFQFNPGSDIAHLASMQLSTAISLKRIVEKLELLLGFAEAQVNVLALRNELIQEMMQPPVMKVDIPYMTEDIKTSYQVMTNGESWWFLPFNGDKMIGPFVSREAANTAAMEHENEQSKTEAQTGSGSNNEQTSQPEASPQSSEFSSGNSIGPASEPSVAFDPTK